MDSMIFNAHRARCSALGGKNLGKYDLTILLEWHRGNEFQEQPIYMPDIVDSQEHGEQVAAKFIAEHVS